MSFHTHGIQFLEIEWIVKTRDLAKFAAFHHSFRHESFFFLSVTVLRQRLCHRYFSVSLRPFRVQLSWLKKHWQVIEAVIIKLQELSKADLEEADCSVGSHRSDANLWGFGRGRLRFGTDRIGSGCFSECRVCLSFETLLFKTQKQIHAGCESMYRLSSGRTAFCGPIHSIAGSILPIQKGLH